jgi:hypothetical protein
VSFGEHELKGLNRPEQVFELVGSDASLVELGRSEEARRELDVVLELRPDFTTDFLALYTFDVPADRQRFVDALRAAGLER